MAAPLVGSNRYKDQGIVLISGTLVGNHCSTVLYSSRSTLYQHILSIQVHSLRGKFVAIYRNTWRLEMTLIVDRKNWATFAQNEKQQQPKRGLPMPGTSPESNITVLHSWPSKWSRTSEWKDVSCHNKLKPLLGIPFFHAFLQLECFKLLLGNIIKI